jgi:hypothetical protein
MIVTSHQGCQILGTIYPTKENIPDYQYVMILKIFSQFFFRKKLAFLAQNKGK